MTLAISILPVCVGQRDLPPAKILVVHDLNGEVGALKARERKEAEALHRAVVVLGDVRGLQEGAERGEGVVEELGVDLGVEITHEEVGADACPRQRTGEGWCVCLCACVDVRVLMCVCVCVCVYVC